MTDDQRNALLVAHSRGVVDHLRQTLGMRIALVVYNHGYFTAFRDAKTTGIDCTDLVNAWLNSRLN